MEEKKHYWLCIKYSAFENLNFSLSNLLCNRTPLQLLESCKQANLPTKIFTDLSGLSKGYTYTVNIVALLLLLLAGNINDKHMTEIK